tara:strand:- start:2825 stop:2995 length:171 start_codon:yes stop_codon:yes gene_type:complete
MITDKQKIIQSMSRVVKHYEEDIEWWSDTTEADIELAYEDVERLKDYMIHLEQQND